MAGPTLADTEDAEEFLEQVDEVSRLIEGLREGTISPDYIDTKQKLKEERNREQQAAQTKGRGPASSTPSKASPSGGDPDDKGDDDAAEEQETQRRERAMEKVKELMANRERKLRARARYEEYVASQDRTRFGTDYTKWNIWCPEDEEDDLINSVGPNTPQFKAMEKDIDERHRQMVERRQIAERCRVRGNEAYKTQQYSEALRCYQSGIESERTNMALHANAAMAALKMSCYVQAIEHADKVLSIADFFHNNKRDPLCVKALQRRAEAYRALGQHARAVEDLAAALQLEPGNAEAAKQLARAKQEDEEARKQRAIAKAVGKASAAAAAPGASSGSGAGGGGGDAEPAAASSSSSSAAAGGAGSTFVTAEVGGARLALDLDKLGRLERLAASLAPDAGAAAASSSSGSAGAGAEGGKVGAEGSAASSSGSQQAGSTKGLPSLPARAKGKAGAAKADGSAAAAAGSGEAPSAVAATCSALRELLRNDDACSVYLRECGGLQHIASRIAKPPAGAPPADLAPLLLLLNDACINDGNLRKLPALKALPAAVAALGGAGEEAAAAAATLLCTAATDEDVRKEVSRLLSGGEGLRHLLAALKAAPPTVQGIALALLGNCMVDKPTKAAMVAAWRQDATAAAAFTGLLRCPNAVLVEKAAVLLGNMATDAALRAQVLSRREGSPVAQLLALAAGAAPTLPLLQLAAASTAGGAAGGVTKGGGGGKGAAAALSPADAQMALDVQRAAATALFNLAMDEAGQQQVAEEGGGLAALYAVAAGPHPDAPLAARAAGICARAARAAAGAAALRELGAVAGMVQVARGAMEGLEARGGTGEAVALLDAAVRALTILTTPDEPALAAELVAAGGPGVLLGVVKGAGAVKAAGGAGLAESVLGNAALCVGGVARRPEHLALLRQADAVAPLVGVAYEGHGNTASKNAAIALARMAHDPAMLERLRELHGLEIIYQYVKP